ncbi:MAG: GNAT family N-acetyltransferase [Spirochaetaceae bacterium]|jgi:L-amino acid N-acyltransferase YncA|nr:GNAT family N-acetyltransferase [Spirochaetaceae bacterium]
MIRNVKMEDAADICDIYNYYVENTVITFEEELVTVDDMKNRITSIIGSLPWIVIEEDGKVLAYAYASPWRVRSAYRFSAELTVYVDKNFQGRKLGSRLYSDLISTMKDLGKHCLYGVVALPNEGSTILHEKLGFTKCGHFHQVGYKFNKWLDVGYWEKIIV